MRFFVKKYELLILIAIIVIASFFRLWQIRDYIVFLGDEGRDMIVMRNIFIKGDLPFLGPTASVGGFYLGPIYYWMAAPFLFLSAFDPVGPSYMVALMGIITVLILFRFLKEATSFWPAAIVTLLYSVAPLIVRYSRSSWNPNPLPLFSLLIIFSVYKAIKSGRLKYYFIAGASFGVAIQLHYLALVMAPIAAIIILINENLKRIHKIIFISIIGFLFTFSPFLLFEIKNNFPNLKTILEFSTRGNTVAFKLSDLIFAYNSLGNTFLEWLTGIHGTLYTRVVFLIFSLLTVITSIIFWKYKEKRLIYSIGLIWLVGGVFLLRSYKGQIYDYYMGALFIAPFFVYALIIQLSWKNLLLRTIVICFSAILFLLFISNGFYTNQPNKLIEQTEDVVNRSLELSEGKSFNFALISNRNSDHAYRYILEIKGHKPTPLEELVTDQLIIICENNNCEPLGNPLWEIAAFGRGEVQKELYLPNYNYKIFRLTHWSGAPSPAGKPAVKGI